MTKGEASKKAQRLEKILVEALMILNQLEKGEKINSYRKAYVKKLRRDLDRAQISGRMVASGVYMNE
jgi:hypothetical protein